MEGTNSSVWGAWPPQLGADAWTKRRREMVHFSELDSAQRRHRLMLDIFLFYLSFWEATCTITFEFWGKWRLFFIIFGKIHKIGRK